MKYYITVTFKDACLCITKSKKITDYVYDSFSIDKWVNRGEHEKAKDSILSFFDDNICDKLLKVEPISNMLHVLCDERPIPTYKNTLRQRYEELDEIAKNCLCKIDNLFYVVDKNGFKKPLTEFTQGKKWVANANIQNGLKTISTNGLAFQGDITWSTLKQRYFFIDNDKYHRIINKLYEWLDDDSVNITTKFTLVDLLLYLADEKNKKDEMITFFQNEQIMTFIHLINKNITATNTFNCATDRTKNFNLARRVVNTAPIYKVYLSGTFIFTIENDTIAQAMMNGSRHATFLENGLAKIVTINDSIDEAFLEMNGFNKIF